MVASVPTVIVAEDQPLLRLGLVQALKNSGYAVVAETADGPSTVEMTGQLKPAVVLIKKELPGLDGVQCVGQIRRMLGNDISLIMLLSSPADFWEALESGANGYALRETVAELLPFAIKHVNAGLGWIGPNIAKYLISGRGLPILLGAAGRFAHAPAIGQLSDRERDVLRLLTNGSSNQKIAQTLGVQLQTVKVHVKNILRKLGVASRSEAISLILKSGLH
jgi:two-component system NarL family response regulator